MDFETTEIFKGKTFADVFKEIHENNRNIDEKIETIMEELAPMVKSINDATILGPIVKDYLDTKIKNNDILVKMLKVVEGLMKSSKSENDDDDFDDMTEDEIENYLKLQKTKMQN